MLQFLIAISLKFCCRKETWDYAKVIYKKKRKRKELKKWTSVRDIEKQWVLRCPLEKKRDE